MALQNLLAAFGPLAPYIGVWNGNGIDIAPDDSGAPVEAPYVEEMILEPAPLLSYGGQEVHALRYQGKYWTSDGQLTPIYEENGYFLWIEQENLVVRQVSNPRGLSILAVGSPNPDNSFLVRADLGNSHAGLVLTQYLTQFANVISYESTFNITAENTICYRDDTVLDMGSKGLFHQTDTATLTRYS